MRPSLCTVASRAVRCVTLLLGFVVPAFTLAAFGAGPEGAAPTEQQLKAAFLYSFAKFVEWPGEAGLAPSETFDLCISGSEQYAVAHDYLAGKSVRGRPVEVRPVRGAADAAGCKMLFVSAGADPLQGALAGVRGPVLTVGESGNFIPSGGMINLVRADNRLRFEIARDAGERAGLRFSSQLLKLATPASGSH